MSDFEMKSIGETVKEEEFGHGNFKKIFTHAWVFENPIEKIILFFLILFGAWKLLEIVFSVL